MGFYTHSHSQYMNVLETSVVCGFQFICVFSEKVGVSVTAVQCMSVCACMERDVYV